jgi:hypothetical protein
MNCKRSVTIPLDEYDELKAIKESKVYTVHYTQHMDNRFDSYSDDDAVKLLIEKHEEHFKEEIQVFKDDSDMRIRYLTDMCKGLSEEAKESRKLRDMKLIQLLVWYFNK